MTSSNTFTPGPTPNTVRTADGKVLTAPDGWILLSPGDAALTRRVKAAGDHWVVREKKGRKIFSRGVWAPAATIERIRAELEAEWSTEAHAKRKEADARRRDKAQAEYVEDFFGAVVAFLGFQENFADLAQRMARAVTDHATPVGSGTVARTRRIPVEQRAEAAVIAWMRHQTTGYEGLVIPRIKGRRREVRRMLARRSHELLEGYRRGEAVGDGCPLKKALVTVSASKELPVEDDEAGPPRLASARAKHWKDMNVSETFSQLGIPFLLFEAPVKESSQYVGLDLCALCGADNVHCFRVADMIVACPTCGTETAVRPGESCVCKSCRHAILCSVESEDALVCCFGCLRAGRAAFTKDTVLGMVTWEQAVEGLTHGVPGLKAEHFELVPSDDDPEWMRARVSPSLLLELVRTPSYTTWQGERWHFCCSRPMIYVGEWKEADFKRHAPDGDGKNFFKKAIIDDVDESFWGILQNVGGPYMFRCSQCGMLGGHYDMD